MQRREFLKSAVVVGGALACGEARSLCMQPSSVQPDAMQVKRVLTMFKCHFDAGFVDTQAAVVNRYFQVYFPQAIRVAEDLRRAGSQRYVWTTGSWLLYEYLEQASTEDRRRMEHAISQGDIAWHALPFSWQTELMDRSMIKGGLAISDALDRRFGGKTTGAKMTDVPGHTRGLVGPLAEHGVTFLDIGVNGASRPAELPPLFLWKDSKGATVSVMYHHEYGSVLQVPGSDLAIAIIVRGDNSGPHQPDEIAKIYSDLKDQFPNAEVIPTSLTAIANALEPWSAHLPVVTQEIGDTWIYGVSSDPLKLARYRELARLRQSWIAQRKLIVGDSTDLALLRHVLLEAEHTWGTDTKTWLDFDHYTPDDLQPMLHTKNYEVVQFSWKEKRQDLLDGIATLPAVLKEEANAALQSLDAVEPRAIQVPSHRAGQWIETAHFLVAIDPRTGAIHKLRNKKNQREWASPEHPLALFSYQALSQDDYARFFGNYIISTADWAKKDFGKPNIERFGAVSHQWNPSLTDLQVEEDSTGHRLLARLEMHDPQAARSGRASFPAKMYMELLFPKAEPVIHLNFSWFGKRSTRLPEALWLTFDPLASGNGGSWTMDKSGEPVSPLDVVSSGSRHLHALLSGLIYSDGEHKFNLETLDAPLIAFGEKSPLNFSRSKPNLEAGIHCNLFNNAWGTNYVQWFGEDMRFRFTLRV